MSFYREQLEQWLKTIEIDADQVLDVGGGAGSVCDRLKSFNAYNYVIADNDAEKSFHKNWSSDESFDLNYDTLSSRWDVIFCLEVFEYIFNPIAALTTIRRSLRDGGIAYISFPAIYPVHEPKQYDYLRYTKNGVIKLLYEAGFDRWEIQARTANDEGAIKLSEFYKADGMHPVRGDRVIYDTGYMVTAYK